MIKVIAISLPLILISTHGFAQDLNTQLGACPDPKNPQCQKTSMGLNESSNTTDSGKLNADSSSNRMGRGMGRGNIHKGFSLHMAKPMILGNCPKRPILKVLKRSQKSVMSCTRKINQHDERSIGRLNVQWTVSPQGEVIKLSTKNTTVHNKSLEKCILSRIKRIRFPKVNSVPCFVRQKIMIRPT